MHHLRLASFGILAAALLGSPAAAQQQPQKQPPAPSGQPQRPQAAPQQAPGRPGQPPQAAAAKSYKPVAVAEPKPLADPSWATFRKQLEDVAKRKDRNALAALIAPNFFWLKDDWDAADKR